ncbi:MAG: HPP family protein [Chromatiales bacterium]|nr:HPP family protein [Gammaproteobacteria bacterium]MCP5351742.1 HPP family protein [Chromatiales bacterium]
MSFHSFQRFIGLEYLPVSHGERLIALFGGVLGIAAVMWLTPMFAPAGAAPLLVASMGASAVLVFGVPHVPLAQPWPLLGGHAISALVGITVGQWVADPMYAGPLAVGLAIGAMHYARCVHPPGGATALSAIVSGPAVLAMGYDYFWVPVMLNAGIIFLAALLINAPFAWRRYPTVLSRRERPGHEKKKDVEPLFSHEDIAYALRGMDVFVDVSEEELEYLFDLARRHARGAALKSAQIVAGHSYSNGEFGERWQVREVLEIGGEDDQEQVIYKVLAGPERYTTGVITRACFARWARHEVAYEGDTGWRKIGAG